MAKIGKGEVGWENAYKLHVHVGCSMQNGANCKLSPLNSQRGLCVGDLASLTTPQTPACLSTSHFSLSLFALLSLFFLFSQSISISSPSSFLCFSDFFLYLFFPLWPIIRRGGGEKGQPLPLCSLSLLCFSSVFWRGERIEFNFSSKPSPKKQK